MVRVVMADEGYPVLPSLPPPLAADLPHPPLHSAAWFVAAFRGAYAACSDCAHIPLGCDILGCDIGSFLAAARGVDLPVGGEFPPFCELEPRAGRVQDWGVAGPAPGFATLCILV